MEDKKLRIISLILDLCLVTSLVLSFVLPDYRPYILLAFICVVIRFGFEAMTQVVVNRKNKLLVALISSLVIAAAIATYVVFFLRKPW